jgi:tetratricopeptide (TPR) repeat protein
MMHSYQKTPENKMVKSIVTLRANLTKDYLRWMTSEYAGFKVLGKDSRLWFEHEIGPKKNEIFCPQEFQPFAMDQKQFTEAFEAAKKRIKDDAGAPTHQDDLWAASVMASQQGKYEDAIKYLEELTDKNPDHKFSWYNLGILCMKNMRAQDSQKAFKQFMVKGSRSWWTAVAAEHLRHMMDS